MSGQMKFAAVLVVLGLVGLVGVFACSSSLDSWLADNCTKGQMERDPQGHRARAWNCEGAPSTVAAKLAKAHKPADRRSTPEGHFLRYSDRMIGVLSSSATATASAGTTVRAATSDAGGKRTKVLDARERDGYGYFNTYVGGWWGSYGGRGESFRGGGPAAGK